MAKKSMVSRDVKRRKIAAQFESKRDALRVASKKEDMDYDEKWDTMIALQKLPRDSAKVRQRNRCALTGRPHGYFRRFGMARTRIREIVMRGEAPGVIKGSW